MLLIRGGRVFGALSDTADVLMANGEVVEVSDNIIIGEDMDVIEAGGCVVAPGLVDMHVHFREPGYEYKEDILSGAAAAAAGGVTTCCCMPNTSPVADNAKVVRHIVDRAKDAPVRVLPYGAVTIGQEGRELTDFAALKAAGAVALSDDGNCIQNAALMYRAMLLAKDLDLLIISHCEDADMVQNYALNEGKVSWELMLPGRPAVAEEIMVARDAMLAAETGARLHIAHVSTARSVDIIRKAKEAGVRITAETCPQYFSLTEDEILKQYSIARVNPPLRTKNDVEAIIDGLSDGTIDVIATDHAPHSADEKAKPLVEAPGGMIGLETSLALALTFLHHAGHLSIDEIITRMSVSPTQIINSKLLVDSLSATVDNKAALMSCEDLIVFDPNEEWTAKPDKFRSKARNTPFAGMKLRGKVKYTICKGEVVFSD